MRKRYWLAGTQVLAILALLLIGAGQSFAQGLNLKHLPTITLQKWTGNPNGVLARDTHFVAEQGPGEKRYFLLPVFIKNCLDTADDPVTGFPGERIFSFRFKLQYNRSLIRAIGVQKRGQFPNDTETVAAKDFNLSWDVDNDGTYKSSTVGANSANGGRIMVTGSSSFPLPLPKLPNAPPGSKGCQWGDTAVFMYVLFEVVGSAQGGSSGANSDQIILTLDSLRFNEYAPNNVTTEMQNRGFDKFQEGVAPTRVIDPSTGVPFLPNSYGASIVTVTPQPRIDLLPPSQVARVNNDPSNYELLFPLQTQYGNPNRIFRNILIVNGVQGTKLRNVTVETSEAWLRVDTADPNVPPGVGQGGTPNPAPGERGMFIKNIGLQTNFNVIANPSLLPTNPDGSGYATPGIYTGYITLRSVDALNSAVRLKVVLIVNRNPLESDLDTTQEPTQTRGVRLLVRNSAPNPDTTYLTFGTGIAASDGVDILFGEAEATDYPSQSKFFARFFPPRLVDSAAAAGGVFNGLIDTRGLPPLPTDPSINFPSLDIRNFKSDTTLVYCVKFSAGAPQNYPLVIEYDTRDFPPNAQVFIRDNVNGSIFNTDMRGSTQTGTTTRTFVIRDPNVTGFCIEYTLPAVVQFAEVREKGWNFVSIPVKPSNSSSGVVFPNASSSKPITFASDRWLDADTVSPGVGYFVKYSETVDRTVSGVPIMRIDKDLPLYITVKVFRGWNTVGALAVPTTIDPAYMSFKPISTTQRAPQRVGEVYSYKPQRGYEQTSLILPGLGYWVKIDGDGYYNLTAPPNGLAAGSGAPTGKLAPSDYRMLNQLTVSDNGQRSNMVYFGQSASINAGSYELPPAPAPGMFDVRFDNNGFVSATKDAGTHTVNFQGVDYPVVLSVANPDADYIVTDAVTGEVVGRFEQGQTGSIRITNPATKSVKLSEVASTSMHLGSAYPNPTADAVSFEFNVPTEQHVSIVLVNSLGNEVATIFNDVAKGNTRIEFETAGLASGTYFYKMTTPSGFSQVRQVVISK